MLPLDRNKLIIDACRQVQREVRPIIALEKTAAEAERQTEILQDFNIRLESSKKSSEEANTLAKIAIRTTVIVSIVTSTLAILSIIISVSISVSNSL